MYYYYGVHKEKVFGEEYWGSPYTHKWVWDFYTPKKQILEIFPYTDEGWIESQEVETRLIKPFYNMDKWCLNENCGGKVSLKMYSNGGKIGGKIGGKKTKERGVGIFGRTKEQRRETSKIGGQNAKERGVGVHGRTKEQMSENGKKSGKIGGKKTRELGVGIFGRTKDQMSEDGKNAGKLGSKITNSRKWMCEETGFISTSGPLTIYQRNRGIDTSKRVRIL